MKSVIPLTLCLILSLQSPPSQASGMTIADLVESGVKGIPGCIDYCLVGVCTHLVFQLFSVSVYISPRVEHNIPEFVVSAYRENGQQTWNEWRLVFSEAQGTVSDRAFSLISPAGELGGYGSYTEEHSIYDRQEIFKEADIIGHPLALIPALLAGETISLTDPNDGESIDSEEDQDEENDEDKFTRARNAANRIVDTNGFAAMFLDPSILEVFSYIRTAKQTYDMIKTVPQALDALSKIADILSSSDGNVFGSGGFKVDYYMCPNTVLPFTPYYLSGLDLFGWRLGIPDRLTHFGDIARSMVPFLENRDIVGSPYGGPPGLGEGNWSPLYPRMGFARNSHDGKVGSVVAQRALDLLLAEDGSDHLGHPTLFNPGFPYEGDLDIIPYSYSPYGVSGGTWQKVWPTQHYQCSTTLYQDKTIADIANDRSAPRSRMQRYAFTFWRRYSCCLQRDGIYIGSVPMPPLCIPTSPITATKPSEETY